MPRLKLDPLSPSGVSFVTDQSTPTRQGQGYVINKVTGLITAGANVTITGQGTAESPYTIASSGSGGGGSSTWGSITGTLSSQTDLQTALNAKEPTISAGTTSQYYRGDKSFQTLDKTAVGLSNVDNTSDATKNSATATLTNKTIDDTNNATLKSNSFTIEDATTVSKKATFDLSGISTGQTRVYTLPNGNTTLLGAGTTQNVTNKDLTGVGNTFPTFNQNTTGTASTITGNITESQVTNLVTDLAAKSPALNPTAVKSSAYTLAANDFVPVDTTSGVVTLTLPTAPANGTRVGAKHIIQGGTNTVTINAGGSDVFNKTGGNTSVTLTLLNQSIQFQYSSGIWYGVAADIGLTALDARYQKLLSLTTTGTSGAATLVGTTLNIPQYAGGSVGGDASTNTAVSVDSEIVLFSGTAGKTLKRATGSGMAKITSGVLSTATSGTDYAPGTSALATGILKSTTTTGALSVAVAADFPTLNQSTTGNAATVTTNANLTGDVTSVGNTTTYNNALPVAKGGTGATANTGTGSNVLATAPTLSGVTITDATDIVLGTTTGTKIGTATTQKLAFFNNTPISKQAATIEIGMVLSNYGLRTGGNTYPITTSGTTTLSGSVILTGATITNSGTLTLPTVTSTIVSKVTGTTTSSATPSPTGNGALNEYTLTAQAAAATFAAPSGTPVDGNELIVRIKDNATSQTLAFNAIYRFSSDLAAPTATVISKTLYMKFKYNSADSRWDCLAWLNNF